MIGVLVVASLLAASSAGQVKPPPHLLWLPALPALPAILSSISWLPWLPRLSWLSRLQLLPLLLLPLHSSDNDGPQSCPSYCPCYCSCYSSSSIHGWKSVPRSG